MGETLTEKVSRLAKEMRDAQQQISACQNEYGVPVRASRQRLESVFDHYEPHGSDPEPIFNHYTITETGWERTCRHCGYTEYTNKLKPVVKEYEPDFGGK